MRKSRWRRLPALRVLAVALLAGGIATLGYISGPLKRVELGLFDARLNIARPSLNLDRVAVVGIDPATEDHLRQAFPFSRKLHARMVDRLRAAGARVIAYDVEFGEPRGRAEDLALIDAIDRAPGNVVLATSDVSDTGQTQVLGGPRLRREIGAVAGDSSLLFDSDGVIRRLTFRPHALPTFAEAAARMAGAHAEQSEYAHDPAVIGPEEPGVRTSWIDFAGKPGTVPTYSFADVLERRVPASALRGKVVVVGVTDPAGGDVHRTSASGSQLMSGPEIQANAIASTLDGLPLRTAGRGLNIALIWLLAILPALAGGRLRLAYVLGISLALLVTFLVVAQLAFGGGTVLAVTSPLLALIVGTAGAVGLRYLSELRARRRTRQLFARFVPEEVVDAAERRRTDSDLRAPVRLDATVLFSDLRGFTSFAEKLPDETVSEMLNRYLSSMSEAIANENGTVTSYMGDGIMAVFGAPAARDDHADRALAAARGMLRRLDEFNAFIRERELGEGFQMGIGLNSGTVISGNVGSDQHLEYAAIGDTTNTAARLEAMTKESGHAVLMAQSTRDRLSGGGADLVRVGALPVRGRDEPVEVWALERQPAPADA